MYKVYGGENKSVKVNQYVMSVFAFFFDIYHPLLKMQTHRPLLKMQTHHDFLP